MHPDMEVDGLRVSRSRVCITGQCFCHLHTKTPTSSILLPLIGKLLEGMAFSKNTVTGRGVVVPDKQLDIERCESRRKQGEGMEQNTHKGLVLRGYNHRGGTQGSKY